MSWALISAELIISLSLFMVVQYYTLSTAVIYSPFKNYSLLFFSAVE